MKIMDVTDVKTTNMFLFIWQYLEKLLRLNIACQVF
jgi:hypothetical protein